MVIGKTGLFSSAQEGATFKSFLLVHRGVFREKELTEALMEPGKIEGSSGTRNLSDNLSDLKAQIAANHKVIVHASLCLFLIRTFLEIATKLRRRDRRWSTS